MATPIAPSFTLEEYAVSASHPDLVEPVPEHLIPVAVRHARALLQPIRDHVDRPVEILSGYRALALNSAVGGSRSSQHRAAEATDITLPGERQADAVRALFEDLVTGRLRIPCGQVIYYPAQTFLHVALPSTRYPEPSFHVHWPTQGYVYRCVASAGDVVQLVDGAAEPVADPEK